MLLVETRVIKRTQIGFTIGGNRFLFQQLLLHSELVRSTNITYELFFF